MEPAIIDDSGQTLGQFQCAVGGKSGLAVGDFLAQPAEQPVEIGKRQVWRFLFEGGPVARAIPGVERP
jgi:hypothetical protein